MRPEDPHVEPPAEAAPSDDEVCPPPSTEPPTLAAPSPLVFRDLFAALTAPREEQIEAPRPPPPRAESGDEAAINLSASTQSVERPERRPERPARRPKRPNARRGGRGQR